MGLSEQNLCPNLASLEGHAQNISSVSFHPELTIILTGSGDGTARILLANTNRLESTLNYGLERVWDIGVLKGSNNMALERKSFKPEYGGEGIYGGQLLGVKSALGLAFYDWESRELVRRIEICCIATEESYFILNFEQETVNNARETNTGVSEDDVDDAFDIQSEINGAVKTGLWVGDCFI